MNKLDQIIKQKNIRVFHFEFPDDSILGYIGYNKKFSFLFPNKILVLLNKHLEVEEAQYMLAVLISHYQHSMPINGTFDYLLSDLCEEEEEILQDAKQLLEEVPNKPNGRTSHLLKKKMSRFGGKSTTQN